MMIKISNQNWDNQNNFYSEILNCRNLRILKKFTAIDEIKVYLIKLWEKINQEINKIFTIYNNHLDCFVNFYISFTNVGKFLKHSIISIISYCFRNERGTIVK